MKIVNHVIGVSLLAGISFVMPVSAHHSTAANFDRNSEITIEGVVTKYKFQNPHVQILVDVTNDDGAIEHWMVELSAKSQLFRSGWTGDEFVAGEKISVTGWEGYRPRSTFLVRAVKADGTEISAGRLLTE
jgi:hypothetical protein